MATQAVKLASGPTRNARKCLAWTGALCLLTAIVGCGPKRMKADFIGFEKAYAETSNREMLLNLARLQNRDPTYFFKLGSINSSYTMGATLSGTGNYSIPTTNNGGQNAIGGGAPGISFSNTPSFTFVPVNDETNARILLNPIPAETFYILYQQGWRADQLFRLMVDRIELTHNNGDRCSVEVFHNTPPQPDPNGKTYAQNDEAVGSFATFLRISAIVYQLQKHGDLLVRGTNTFVPFDNQDDPKNQVVETKNDINSAEMAKALEAGESWHVVNGHRVYGKETLVPGFFLSPVITGTGLDGKPQTMADTATIAKDITSDPDFAGLASGIALAQTLEAISRGFSIEGANPPAIQSAAACRPGADVTPHLVMRSLLGMMSAASQEEAAFNAMVENNPTIHASRFIEKLPANAPPDVKAEYDKMFNSPPTFTAYVPRLEQLPALQLRRVKGTKEDSPLVEVEYKGKSYLIADVGGPETVPQNLYWNRDMFRLLSQLISQVTVDISKFPVPQILQLHTD